MTQMTIYPQSVCSDRILVDVDDDGVIEKVVFEGGCEGNGKALARLLKGMKARKAVEILRGVDCEGKGTSCADQLACGMDKLLSEREEKK